MASADKDVHCSPPQSTTPRGRKSNQTAVYIELDVGQVDIGQMAGTASEKVKIYGDRIMVQMTNEDLSFRIICANVVEFEASLEQQPFFLKLKVSDLQYKNGKMHINKKGKSTNPNETVQLHLTYETEVPSEVKSDLRELFKERLQDNWKEVLIPSLQKSPDSAKAISPSTKESPQSSAMKRKHQENDNNETKNDSGKRNVRRRTTQKDFADKGIQCSPPRPTTSGANTSTSPGQRWTQAANVIVLKVERIYTGLVSGLAPDSVKIYDDTIMAQMKDKELSFSINCQNITKVEVSLEKRPFFVMLKVSNVHYKNRKKNVKTKGKPADTSEIIIMHLDYETEVRSEVKARLRELARAVPLPIAAVQEARKALFQMEDDNQEQMRSPESKAAHSLTTNESPSGRVAKENK